MTELEAQLAKEMAEKLTSKYSGVHITGIHPSAVDPSEIWIDIIYPQDLETEMKARDYAASLSTHYYDTHRVDIIPVSGSHPTLQH